MYIYGIVLYDTNSNLEHIIFSTEKELSEIPLHAFIR